MKAARLVIVATLAALVFAGCNGVGGVGGTGGTAQSKPISTPLSLAVTYSQLGPLDVATASVSGGSPPYSAALISGGGSLSTGSTASYTYTAPATPTFAQIRVTDSIGVSGDIVITVNPALALSPPTLSLTVGDSTTFSAAQTGAPPYTYSVLSGPGTIGSSSGIYSAGASTGSATIKVTDAFGATATASVSVLSQLAITPTTATLSLGNQATFARVGGTGVAPVHFAMGSGGGSVNSTTGVFTAGSSAGTSVVDLIDAVGNVAQATVTVNPQLSISPASPTLVTSGTTTFAGVAGTGVAPYTLSLVSGIGAFNPATGVYTAPGSTGTAVIRVTDSLANTAQTTVAVVPQLAITPTSATLEVGNVKSFSAVAGTGISPFTYSVFSGGGSINSSTGVYVAPASSGTAVVKVTDGIGETATANVTINPQLAITPAAVILAVSDVFGFGVVGGTGVGPYTYSVKSGGGSINSFTGSYTAPASAGTATIQVTDSLGNTSTAAVTINPQLAITPTSKTMVTGNTATFAAVTGTGVSPYAYSVTSGPGAVNAATGVYTAGAGPASAVVTVTDALNNTASANVTLIAAPVIVPATVTVAVNQTATFSVQAATGIAPYTYAVVAGGGSVNSSSGLYTAPSSPGTATVRVTDSTGITSDATVTIDPALAITPTTKTLAVNNTATFAAVVGSGVSPYSFSLLSGTGSVNSASGVYTAPASSGSAIVRVTDNSGATADATVTVNAALAIQPAAVTLATGNSYTFNVSAGTGVSPYTFAITSGSGSVNASTGVFTAPGSAGTTTVQVTDAIGNTSSATVTINAALAITPSTKTLAVGNSTTFSAQAGTGVAPYSFSLLSGGGALNSSTGAYTAPATSGAADVRVTDALGNTADASVTINPALAVTPTTSTLAVTNTVTFTAVTGTGVSPYTYTSTGVGSIGLNTGIYSAGASSGSATITVTDALSNTATATVTVNPALAISPGTLTITAGSSSTFSVTAGTGVSPYTFSVVSGGGHVNSTSGIYRAPSTAGSATVQVTDAVGNTSTASVTINAALAITPTTKTLAVNNTVTFAAVSGTSPFSFGVVSGTGSVNAASGVYTAPASSGSATVRVTDNSGATADATVTVNPALVIQPTAVTLATGNSYTFGVSSGTGVSPYTFAITSGAGSINAGTGAFTAPGSAGTTTVQVTDAIGNTSSATVTINAALAITPSTKTLAVGNATTFGAQAGTGVAPYSFSLVSGGGTLNSVSGAYTAPATSGSADVRVTDALGNTADATVTITPALAITPTTKTLAVTNTVTFAAVTGTGVSPYTYTSTGVGSIGLNTGIYSAGASSGSATITVTDALSNTATATVTVNPALAITPSTLTITAGSSSTFSVTGGTGVSPYTYSVVSGGGSIGSTSGLYTAPASAGSATVQATDAVGNTSTAAVTINAALAITPTTKTLAVNNTVTFAAVSGSSPFSFSVVSGTGSVNSASGVYTAPASSGSATVRVTDNSGATADATVTVNPALVIQPSTLTLATGNSYTFGVSTGTGVSPYSYAITSGSGSIIASTGAFTAPGSAGTTTVQVTDAVGNMSSASITVNAALAITPSTKTLAVGNSTTFSAQAGSGVTPYSYSLVSGGGTLNSLSGAYTAPATPGSAVVRLTDALGNTADANVTINSALAVTPTTTTLAVTNTATFAAVTGTGVSPYTYTSTGVGSIGLNTGIYSAGASSGSATITVTDALSNTATATVTVNPALAISPGTLTITAGSSSTFSVTAGTGVAPYTYSVLTGGGSISSTSGSYTAPASTGSATVQVTDAAGNTSNAAVTINGALAITPSTLTLAVNNTSTFGVTAGTGVSPFSYAVTSGTGSVNSSSGLYTAPASTGSAIVTVTDSLGATSSASVTIAAALAISPATLTAGTGETYSFSASGGVPSYSYSITSGSGTIGSSTGTFVAPSSAGAVTVTVTDQLGNTSSSTVSVIAPSSVAAGSSHTCATLSDGTLKCWGSNSQGELGLGNTASYGTSSAQMQLNLPTVSLGSGRSPAQVALGTQFTCALLDDSNVKCWGLDNDGQLGQGSTTSIGTAAGQMGDNLSEISLGTGLTASSIAAGASHACAILTGGVLKCWGGNSSGQLGQSNTTNVGTGAGQMGDSLAAIDFGGPTASAVCAGALHTCALLSNSTVVCWGDNSHGQLGQGNTANAGDSIGTAVNTLAAISLGTALTPTGVACGASHSCAMFSDGSMKCWGDNANGQLGQGTSTDIGTGIGQMGDSLPAISLGTGRTATAILASASDTCAVLDDSTIKCWGAGANGQPGQGSTSDIGSAGGQMGDSLPAISLGSGRTVSSAAGGGNHFCALLDNVTVKCFGLNSSGELGQGSTTDIGTSSTQMGDNLPITNL